MEPHPRTKFVVPNGSVPYKLRQTGMKTFPPVTFYYFGRFSLFFLLKSCMSKNTVEDIKYWRIQWGLVFWPKGPWDVKVRFLLSHVSLLKPDVSIHKAALELWINLVKFLEKNSCAENYQTLDSPGVRPCKLELETDVSHTLNTKIIGVTRGGIHHKSSLIWSQAEPWKQLLNTQSQRPLPGSVRHLC